MTGTSANRLKFTTKRVLSKGVDTIKSAAERTSVISVLSVVNPLGSAFISRAYSIMIDTPIKGDD